jgi:hypothetical protein
MPIFAPVAQDAMKVILAAQVMSHTVGASLNRIASQGKEHCSAFIVRRSKVTYMNLTYFLV